MPSFTKQQMLSLLSEFLGRPVTIEECKQAELDQTEQWYSSGQTDFSVYAHEKSLLACASYTIWQSLVHVERPTKYLRDHGFRVPVKNVVDHGCGLGFSTLLLGQLYPRARVIGTNVPGVQMEFNRFLLSKFSPRNVELIDERELDDLRLDRVYLLCLEVFEHFKKPLVELRHLIELLRPVMFAESSSFAVRATGHFDEYDFDGDLLPNTRLPSDRFNTSIKSLGYERQPACLPTHRQFWYRPRLYITKLAARRLWGGITPSAVNHHRQHALRATLRSGDSTPSRNDEVAQEESNTPLE